MKTIVSDIAFTPAVKSQQERMGSREGYARMEQSGGWSDRIDTSLKAFIAECDSFYLGTASAERRPYIQHRGGPKGFLKVLDASTLAFADYAGNRQYVSAGNLSENDKAYIFLMDYPNRQRLKILARASVVDAKDDPALVEKLVLPEYKARIERAIVFDIEGFDWNCPQHITPRFTEGEWSEMEG